MGSLGCSNTGGGLGLKLELCFDILKVLLRGEESAKRTTLASGFLAVSTLNLLPPKLGRGDLSKNGGTMNLLRGREKA